MRRVLAVVLMVLAAPVALAETKVPQSQTEISLGFAPLVKQAAPAVVNIYAKRVIQTQDSPFAGDPFFEQFFKGFGTPRPRVQNSLGSGVILSGDGIVVTNYHVVGMATDIRVVMADRREYSAEVMLADEEADLAVLRLDGGKDLPHLSLRNSDRVEVGELVLAIGNPFGVGQTVSSGIVSGLARTGRGGGAYTAGGYFVQTDAPINPGNSGGALVDMAGRLVGINTQIVTKSGGSNGIGFAVPANLVARVVAQAEAGEASFIRPWAGVDVQPIDADIAEALGFDRPRGVLVQNVAGESPFGAAGVRPGDILLAIGEHPVNAPAELGFRLSLQELGSEVPITFQRDGTEQTVTVEMRAAVRAEETLDGGPVKVTGLGPFDGVVLQEIGPALRDRLGLPADRGGVIVLALDNPRQVRNFQPGDIVAEVNDTAIATMEDFRAVTEAALADGRRSWKVVLNRRGGLVYLTWRG